jgi:hypothetical protein
MDGKAEKLGRKRLLDVSGVIGIQLVLFGKPPMRPFGSLLLTADRIQFAKQNIAEASRRGGVKANGGKDFRLRIGLGRCRFFCSGNWRTRRKSSRPVEPTTASARPPLASG